MSRKLNRELGYEVHKHLVERKVETPMISSFTIPDDAGTTIEDGFRNILNTFGLDLSDDSLQKTPERMARMYFYELFWGLNYSNFPDIMAVENKMAYDEMIMERNISVKSVCEHHLVPFIGKCHVAYLSSGKLVGLSKLNRVVDFFCRRPQIQERLTEQIYHALSFILNTEDIAVVIEAKHLCVSLRGVKDENSDMVTSKLGGRFKSKPELRAECMSFIQHK